MTTRDDSSPARRWVRNHTVHAYGPVREVERGLVLEIAFDAAQFSGRHKSGVALRFPRVARLRWDKPVAEADRLDTLVSFIEARGIKESQDTSQKGESGDRTEDDMQSEE